MNNLNIILEKLKKKGDAFKGSYFIPEAWNFIEYDKYSTDKNRNGQININPYDFIIYCIENHILSKGNTCDNALMPLGCKNNSGEVDLTGSVIYSMFPRIFTAWDHYNEGEICGGTFLKAICLLPYLKNLDVNIIYLMPIFECGNKYKKGELSSPYAIKNIYKLDKNFHDDLLGESSESIIKLEFKAFVEACHVLGMQVMVDFVFRTVSRDNELMVEHPEWFYWIGSEYNETFKTPDVEREKKCTLLNSKTIRGLYKSKDIKRYLSTIRFSPQEIDADRWEKVTQKYKETGENILSLIEDAYQITTVPGFSDVLNDPQPPWTDVTYLKFYYDTHKEAMQYVDESQPPYILQDGACLNVFHGERIISELWDYISGVIPHYQQEYGIDGARIDMGHALPTELNKGIIERAKANNKKFLLWSEEFNTQKSFAAKEDGFHFISGTTWGIYKDIEKQGFYKKLMRTLMNSAIPLTGALETPDTPRAALVHKDKRKIELLMLLNCFIPNAVMLINNGFEIREIQPMNLGLDNTEEGRFVLEKHDPMYGKLAFFDNYRMHWLNPEQERMKQLLSNIFSLRRRFINVISKKENFIMQSKITRNRKIMVICYIDNKLGENVFFAANRNFKSRARVNFKTLLPKQLRRGCKTVKLVYENGQLCSIQQDIGESRFLMPGQVIIGCVE